MVRFHIWNFFFFDKTFGTFLNGQYKLLIFYFKFINFPLTPVFLRRFSFDYKEKSLKR